MPQLGPMEILIVAVVALIVFGPQRLPEIARTIGRTLQEFRRQAADIRSEFEAGIDSFDPKIDEVDDEEEPPRVGKAEPALDPAAGDASSDVTAGTERVEAGDGDAEPGSTSVADEVGTGSELDDIPAKPSRTEPDMRPDR